MVNFSQAAVTLDDFRVFAVASIIVTTSFSAIIIAIIRKGTIRDGIQYIPIFVTAGLVVFFLARMLLNATVGTML